jgi:hypothetical protein
LRRSDLDKIANEPRQNSTTLACRVVSKLSNAQEMFLLPINNATSLNGSFRGI